MTKKDYIAIAKVLAAHRMRRPTDDSDGRIADRLDDVTEAFADMLAADNPRFDRVRFLAACSGTRP